MKKFSLVLFLLFFSLVFLHAKGKPEEPANTLNNEWTLCITAFDVSALPPSQRIIGDILVRDLVAALKGADYRYRDEEETAFHENRAWTSARSTAAKALAAKRTERDLLIFQGEADWRYRANLKTKDAEIEKLEENLKKIDDERPLVNQQPVFQLVQANINGSWPAPPAPGDERRFCTAQRADAFITGSLSEFHDRILVNIKMYTLHNREYTYEDMVIFSSEDIQEALDELSDSVFAAILGTGPAKLAIHVQPEDSIVLVDGKYAGRGETDPTEYAPGTKEIEVISDGFIQVRLPVDLFAWESTELFINLTPLALDILTVHVPGNEGSSVYLGSRYLGTTPFIMELPPNESAYITVETFDGQIGSAVFQDGMVVRGEARYTRDDSLVYSPIFPVNPNEERVNTAKTKFYNSYGRFWIALPLSLILVGVSENYINAYDYRPTQDMYNMSLPWSYVRIGAYAALGAAAVDLAYRVVRYLYISRSDATPLARFPDGEN